MEHDISALEQTIIELMHSAGDELEKAFYATSFDTIQEKGQDDLVTSADLASEKLFLETLVQKYPRLNILSEESAFIDNASSFTVILDPLDGTKEFKRGNPDFQITAAVEVEDEIQLGIIYKPISRDLYTAQLGKGALKNRKMIKTSNVSYLDKSYVYTIFPLLSTNDTQAKIIWEKLYNINRNVYRVRGMGNTNDAFTRIAQGGFDGYVNLIGIIKGKWDIAAATIILTESGGVVTDLDNNPLRINNLPEEIIASNGRIHEGLIQILKT